MRVWLLILALSLTVWADELRELEFNVYPAEAQWCVVKSGNSRETVSRATVTVLVRKLEHNPEVTVLFTHPWFIDKFEPIQPDALNGVPPNKQGKIVWPRNGKQIVLTPKNPLLGIVYTLYFQWPVTALTLAIAGASLAYAWRRNRHSKKLQDYAEKSRLLAAHASQKDDPLVKDQKTLGPYKIIDKLGEGGMATVYKAVPTETLDEREAVAIKLMKPDMTSPEDRKRFLREIQVVRELNHPHIVRLENYGETPQNELYMAMELVDGSPLAIYPKGQPVEEVSTLLRPILGALTYAHGRGVVHRDIKPGNILVTRSGQVKLMDFGLARTHDASQLTKTGTMLGSPAYAPPEQLTGGLLDPRSDQYSLGATLYEMLTGSVPFEKADVLAVLMAHMVELPRPLRERRSDLSPSLERVVLRMLEKSPQARFTDMVEMGKAWEQALLDPNAFADWVRPGAAVSPETGEPLLPGNVSLQSSGDDTIC